ncbi:MAG: hypothetical protein IPJ06_03355 [Saprospiraceae bacterium]|nr:hypothetical protein [Saprospiraceae bacterium]
MIETLISSKIRIKLLFNFFFNGPNRRYLRTQKWEFGGSLNGNPVELGQLVVDDILTAAVEGNRQSAQTSRQHSLDNQMQQILIHTTGTNRCVSNAVHPLGHDQNVVLIGDLARDIDTLVIDLPILFAKARLESHFSGS